MTIMSSRMWLVVAASLRPLNLGHLNHHRQQGPFPARIIFGLAVRKSYRYEINYLLQLPSLCPLCISHLSVTTHEMSGASMILVKYCGSSSQSSSFIQSSLWYRCFASFWIIMCRWYGSTFPSFCRRASRPSLIVIAFALQYNELAFLIEPFQGCHRRLVFMYTIMVVGLSPTHVRSGTEKWNVRCKLRSTQASTATCTVAFGHKGVNWLRSTFFLPQFVVL